MTQTPSEAAAAALRRMELPILRDEQGNLLTVYRPSLAEQTLIIIGCDDDAREALLGAELCAVPEPRRSKVALLLAQLNADRKFVVYSMPKSVWVETAVDLKYVVQPEAAITVALLRLFTAIHTDRSRILRAVQAKSRRSLSLAEREVAKILADLPSVYTADPDLEA